MLVFWSKVANSHYDQHTRRSQGLYGLASGASVEAKRVLASDLHFHPAGSGLHGRLYDMSGCGQSLVKGPSHRSSERPDIYGQPHGTCGLYRRFDVRTRMSVHEGLDRELD